MHINDAATEDVRRLKTIKTNACSVERMKPKSCEQGRFFTSFRPGHSSLVTHPHGR